jgi:predicted nucleic-acid-binding protein/DNA replication protein DnaC
MGGVRYITQKALHGMSAQRTVSIQEAVHMVDNQDLVICSEKFTYLSLRQGAMLTSEKDGAKKKDIVTMYRNRSKELANLSMDDYFYNQFCRKVLKDEGGRTEATKHRILLPVGQNCKPRYPVTYEYAKGVLIQHKPWSKDKPLTNLLKSRSRTIQTFKRMMDKKQFPSCVRNQYILAMKYSKQAKLEFLNKQPVQQPYDLSNMDDEEKEAYIAHQNVSHFSDGRHHNKVIDGMTVDIGTNFDWSESLYKEDRDVSIDGTSWVDSIREQHVNAVKDQAQAVDNLVIPTQKNGDAYDIEMLSDEQKSIVHDAVHTVMKFLTNDPNYKPMRATVMGSGGTGKSFIINTIISMVRTLTCSNDTVQIAAPSGAAAFNVQGSTIHNLLGVRVSNPEKGLTEQTKARLLEQLERLLVLIIDERSMISSKVLAAAERNTRECIYRGQNASEIWGGLPVVLLFGDDYQLMPVDKNGAINGYDKRCCGAEQHVTDKMTPAQLFAYHGDWLFTEVMTDRVYFLTKNYRVQCEEFKALLERVRKSRPTQDDADKLMKLHHVFYRNNADFKENIENHKKTMWLFSNNADVRKKNVDKLVETSKTNKVPVARLNCWYDTNKTQSGKERRAYLSHFDSSCYKTQTDLCVGARVALRSWNILPCAGLYNGSIGTVVDIVYKNNPIGPNDKQHNHLPDYVVVDFPHLTLPSYIEPWDKLHPTVITMTNDSGMFLFL